MPVDKFGLPFFYPTKLTGGLGTGAPFFYQQSDNILNDDHFNGEGDITSSSGGVWVFETSGPTSVQIFKNTDSANSIGGCGMNFADTVERGYGYKLDDPRDIELKFLLKVEDSASDNGLAIEGPTGRHSDSGCCQGFSYKVTLEYRTTPVQFRYRKEMWHVSNHDDPKTGSAWTHPIANFKLLDRGSYIGIGYVHYLKKDGALGTGHNTNDSIVLETWINPNPDLDKNNWVMIKRTEDKGGWGDDGDHCDGDKDQIGAWSNSNFRIKSNDEGGVFRIKALSLREIDPTRSFDDDPETPPPGEEPPTTSTILGQFKFLWDVNTLRTSPCAGTGTSLIYQWNADLDKEISDNAVFNDRTKIVEVLKNSSSVLSGKLVKSVVVPLKKAGTPGATPTVKCKIWSSSNVTLYTSPTEIDPTTLTGSFSNQTFDFSTNTHTLVTGDRIGVEYLGTSSTNYVICGYQNGTNTDSVYASYNNTTDIYSEFADRDFGAAYYQ